MQSSTFARASAATLVAGGILGALVPVLHPGHGAGYYTHPMTAPAHLALFVAVLLVSLGLPWAAAVAGAGRPSAVGGAAAFFAGLACLDGSHGLIDGAVLPALAARPGWAPLLAAGHGSDHLLAGGLLTPLTTAGVALIVAGSLALGSAVARSRVVPRAVGLALALAWVLVPLSMFFPALRGVDVAVPYVALAALGVAAARRRRIPALAPAAAPRPAAA